MGQFLRTFVVNVGNFTVGKFRAELLTQIFGVVFRVT